MAGDNPYKDLSEKWVRDLELLTETIKRFPASPRTRRDRFNHIAAEVLGTIGVALAFALSGYLGYLILSEPRIHTWLIRVFNRPLPWWVRMILSSPLYVLLLSFIWSSFKLKDPDERKRARMIALVLALVILAAYLWGRYINLRDVLDNPEYP